MYVVNSPHLELNHAPGLQLSLISSFIDDGLL